MDATPSPTHRSHPDGERFLTRAELVQVIRAEVGVPLSGSRFNKDTMSGVAPKPAAYYGRRQLYTRADALAYGRSLLTTTPQRLRGSRSGLRDEAADRGA